MQQAILGISAECILCLEGDTSLLELYQDNLNRHLRRVTRLAACGPRLDIHPICERTW